MGKGGQIWLKCTTVGLIIMIRYKKNIFETVENFPADLAWNYPLEHAKFLLPSFLFNLFQFTSPDFSPDTASLFFFLHWETYLYPGTEIEAEDTHLLVTGRRHLGRWDYVSSAEVDAHTLQNIYFSTVQLGLSCKDSN